MRENLYSVRRGSFYDKISLTHRFTERKTQAASRKLMRKLTPQEISLMEQRGCSAQSWDQVEVHPHFDASRCRNVAFAGHCSIGDNRGSRPNPDMPDYEEPYGITDARLINCTVGDRVIIRNVRDCIAYYHIESDVVIRDVATIKTSEESTFGNGTEISVINETGGREVRMCDFLTSQTAYMMAMYRHDLELQKALSDLVDVYCDGLRSRFGTIDTHAQVMHCGSITNVKIGSYAIVSGSSVLHNGSINSTEQSPVHVGYNVIARDFIFSSGSSITDGVNMVNCFVGQGCTFSHLFSAHDSLFFANCQGENGEACAIFAGPYTVTMHKSSLLIAGYFSFLNAGSGSNQSNHLYKLGPIHQGIVERGSKTTSDSYVLWPSRIGPFSLVMGRHVDHIDTSDFPFSYIIENDNKSYLVPGTNLRSVGTIRDAKKWPKRDKRHPEGRLDCINFNLLSPYTVGKMYKGIQKLRTLEEHLGSHISSTYIYHDIHIRHHSLENGCRYYEMGIVKFLGNSLIQRIQDIKPISHDDLLQRLPPQSIQEQEDWLDLSGLIVPRSEIRTLLTDLREGKYSDIRELNDAIHTLHTRYYEMEWEWAYDLLLKWYRISPDELTIDRIRQIIAEWHRTVIKLDEQLHQDAHKEFEMLSQVGFGIDLQSPSARVEDFEQVRGDFESNPFVQEVEEHMHRKSMLRDDIMQLLDRIS